MTVIDKTKSLIQKSFFSIPIGQPPPSSGLTRHGQQVTKSDMLRATAHILWTKVPDIDVEARDEQKLIFELQLKLLYIFFNVIPLF